MLNWAGNRGREGWSLIRDASYKWFEDSVMERGAALAFYTIFAISPLFLILTYIAGLWFGHEAARAEVIEQLRALIGDRGAEAARNVMLNIHEETRGVWASIVALVTLLIGVTTVFAQLQTSLNAIWKVEPRPGNLLWDFIKTRLLSFAMVVGIGFLLLVSLLLSAALAAISKFFDQLLPGLAPLWQVANFIISFGVVVLLFAMIFKYLPDVEIGWREVWIGAFVTALLFTVGKFLIGFYLGRSAVASTFGAAGSLVLILLWVYYSSLIVFFGAELTQVHAHRAGSPRPSKYAKKRPDKNK